MNVRQISKEHTPELFFLPQIIDGVSVYNVATETTLIPGGFAKRRRSKGGGVQEYRVYPTHMELWLYADDNDAVGEQIATAQIWMQVIDWDTNDWVDVSFSGVQPVINDFNTHFTFAFTDAENRTSHCYVNWQPGNAKQTYTVTSMGEKVRAQGRITFASDGIDDQLVVDPYLEVEEQSSAITITAEGDEITWTVATANAVLAEPTPVRAVITDDNG